MDVGVEGSNGGIQMKVESQARRPSLQAIEALVQVQIYQALAQNQN